jgi:hypothetical protein
MGLPPQSTGSSKRANNGTTSAALITLDAGAVPTELWEKVSQKLERELGIPATNVLITATHTHSVPFKMAAGYADLVFNSVKMAKDKRQPARMSYGTGLSYINVQRDMIDEEKRTWWEGANYEGLSDKTVAVIKFETLTGAPIAVYYNYAVHAVITGALDLVSGDIPGASSRYIEDSFDDKVVGRLTRLWTWTMRRAIRDTAPRCGQNSIPVTTFTPTMQATRRCLRLLT